MYVRPKSISEISIELLLKRVNEVHEQGYLKCLLCVVICYEIPEPAFRFYYSPTNQLSVTLHNRFPCKTEFFDQYIYRR
ncbi:hypothetical protein D3C85_1742980 [compost metagenome]